MRRSEISIKFSEESSSGTNGTCANGMVVDERNRNLNSYPRGGCYLPYGSRFRYFPGHGNIHGYPSGVGIIYGLTQIAPGSPWTFGVRGGLVPYGNAAPFYPTYLGLPANGYNGMLITGYDGKSNQMDHGGFPVSGTFKGFGSASS